MVRKHMALSHPPPFNVIDPEILVRWNYLFPMQEYLFASWKYGYPFFIWNDKTERFG